RRDLSGDHQLGAAEEVLVVRASGRAVGEHERRLTAPAGTPTALSVVRGGGRHIPKTHDAQLRDVDAELHRWRAVEDGQTSVAKRLLSLLANAGWDLGGMFARDECWSDLRGAIPVEVDEK